MRATRPLLPAALAIVALLGCNLAAGVDEFATVPPVEPATGGGSSSATVGGGGSGGTGGAGDDCLELGDSFDGAFDTTKWSLYEPGNGGTVTQEGGHLVINVDARTTSRDAGVESVERFDLRDCPLHVQLVKPIAASGTNAWFFIENSIGERVGFEQNGLVVFLEAPGVSEPIVYNPGAPIWLRLRWQMGALLYDMSTDGIDWTTHMQMAAMPEPDSVQVELGAAAFSFDMAGGARFDNFNRRP